MFKSRSSQTSLKNTPDPSPLPLAIFRSSIGHFKAWRLLSHASEEVPRPPHLARPEADETFPWT